MKKRAAKSAKPTFGIIGYGRFGKLWASCLKPLGEVKVFDKISSGNSSASKKIRFVSLPEVARSDLVFLLVPISRIDNICKKIATLLPPETVVIDACSVKAAPVRAMEKLLPKGQPVIATHPLFGPDSVKRFGLKNQKIVVCDVHSSKTQLRNFEKILKELHLKIIHATPEQHDRQMARSQALVHFIGRALADIKLHTQAISTPDYQTLLRMNEMVHNDTWELFYDMQSANPYTKKTRQIFLRSLQKLDHDIIKKTSKTGR